MTRYKQGQLVLVQFPLTDATGQKRRPALVVSSDHYNATSPDVIIAAITSRSNATPHAGDHQIVGWQQAGLLTPSLAQAKLATVSASQIDRAIGALEKADLGAVQTGLRTALGI